MQLHVRDGTRNIGIIERNLQELEGKLQYETNKLQGYSADLKEAERRCASDRLLRHIRGCFRKAENVAKKNERCVKRTLRKAGYFGDISSLLSQSGRYMPYKGPGNVIELSWLASGLARPCECIPCCVELLFAATQSAVLLLFFPDSGVSHID